MGNGIFLRSSPVPFIFHVTAVGEVSEHWLPAADEYSLGHLVSGLNDVAL